MVEKARPLNENETVPNSEVAGDRKFDSAGPPIMDQAEIEKLQQEATTDKGELPPFDVAAMAYKLGMTPQELKAYMPAEKAKTVRKLTKEEVLAMHKETKQKEDRELAAKLEASIEGAEKSKKERMEKVFAQTPDEQIDKARTALEAAPETAKAFSEMIEAHNQEALREKSQLQLDQLKQEFFGEATFWEQKLPWKKKERAAELSQKENKLATFKAFVEGLKPVNKESVAEKPDTHTEDDLVRADDYVAGSFVGPDKKGFGIDRFHTAGEDEIDPSVLDQSGQIVTNNVHFIANRVPAEKLAQTYLDNTFDYQTGQEILATYMASVFETPDEAANFLNDNYNKNDTTWNYRLRPKMGEYSANQGKRREEILQATEKIYGQTGILPPTNMEVRVDRAAIQEEAVPKRLAA